jgi:hypothetical protein
MPDLLLLDRVFPSPGGKVVFFANNQLMGVDCVQRKVVNQTDVPLEMAGLKAVVWN